MGRLQLFNPYLSLNNLRKGYSKMRTITLFLGAGFSKPWGLPLASELLPDSEEKWVPIIKLFQRDLQTKLAENVQKSWWKYRKECKEDGVNVSVDEFARALQSVERGAKGLSFAGLTHFLAMRLAVEHSVIRKFHMRPQYTEHYIEMQNEIKPCYDELMKELSKDSLRGIVTTNYDLVVEKILGPDAAGRLGGFHYWTQGQPVNKRHSEINTQRGIHRNTIDGTIPLLKLHGSLNWALLKEKGIDVYVDCYPSLTRGHQSLIVPPHDSSHNEILSQIQLKASEVLKDADVWVFCGYSFPDYDIDNDIGHLLKSSAYNLRRVVILSPHAEDLEKKVRNLLNAAVPELEVKCGPGLDAPEEPKLTPILLHSLISGN
jgi:hypothetical protein